MVTKAKKTYSDFRDAFFDELFLIAKKDKDVVLLMGDQGAKSFEKFKKDIPSQFINAGIAEQNMVSVAAGLTLGGKKAFIHSIINFLTLRAYEQIKVDLSIMNLPVVLVGVGAGYAYGSDGPTHHSNQDIAAMRAIPGMTILNASDTVSLAAFSHLSYKSKGPVYVRFDKGNVPVLYAGKHDFRDGISQIQKGKDVSIVSTGLMVHNAILVSKKLKERDIDASVIDLYRIKPLNEKLLMDYLGKSKAVITLEEHLAYGGVGSTIADFIADRNLSTRFLRFGIDDSNSFVYGDRKYMHKKSHLDVERVADRICSWL